MSGRSLDEFTVLELEQCSSCVFRLKGKDDDRSIILAANPHLGSGDIPKETVKNRSLHLCGWLIQTPQKLYR